MILNIFKRYGKNIPFLLIPMVILVSSAGFEAFNRFGVFYFLLRFICFYFVTQYFLWLVFQDQTQVQSAYLR